MESGLIWRRSDVVVSSGFDGGLDVVAACSRLRGDDDDVDSDNERFFLAFLLGAGIGRKDSEPA